MTNPMTSCRSGFTINNMGWNPGLPTAMSLDVFSHDQTICLTLVREEFYGMLCQAEKTNFRDLGFTCGTHR